ncbi:Major facilitator superfamily domain, general substrate transporter [Pseudocohnilembus persalinus]|uniref:Lysosomal dipeptide transporter MFSD1 n=1 Tax=Pseudocohnilembus persalinus TaxID=266149 RepID=A0A0V0R892_PSEPJ|nr:Major facilitator superfamily domain, general substrate transporter [Pseudocohnilembus persalinus]|eukprot:KRX10717.1 Major facilitator superfamily domain, general substrate transporter [Pseudocohnilembus persalinus]
MELEEHKEDIHKDIINEKWYENYIQNLNDIYKYKKWMLLFMGCTAGIMAQVAFVFPTYFQVQLEKLFQINEVQFNFLYSVQNIPNIIVPFLIGILTSKYGVGQCQTVLIFIVLIGHILQYTAVKLVSYKLILFARLFIGIGFANYQQVNLIMLTQWFIGKNLGLATSLQMISGKIGVSLAGIVFSQYQELDKSPSEIVEPPLLYILIGGIGSFILCLYVIKTDYVRYIREKRRKLLQKQQNQNQGQFISLVTQSYDKVQSLPGLYWQIIVLGSLINSIYYGFVNNIQVFLKICYNIEGQITGLAYVVAQMVASCVSPISALICDGTGNFRNVWWVSAILVFLPIFFISSQYQFQQEYLTAMAVPMLFGMFFGIVNPMRQPSIRYAVHEDQYTVATGLALSYINLVLTGFPVFYGYILQKGVVALSWFFVIVGLIFFSGSVFLNFYDMSKGNKLIGRTRTKRQQQQQHSQNHTATSQNGNNNAHVHQILHLNKYQFSHDEGKHKYVRQEDEI